MRSIDMLSVASGQETVETTGRLDLTFHWFNGAYKFHTCMTLNEHDHF